MRMIENGIANDRIVMVTFGEQLADPRGSSLDRRAIVYATTTSPRSVVAVSLAKKHALSVSWAEGDAVFSQSRGRTLATR